jgi:hypothetical protein
MRYRAGDLEGAVELLEDDRANEFEWYFLAMAHHRLGNTDKARDYYERACAGTAARGVDTHGWDALFELLVFRAETESVLGIEREN